MDSDTVKTSKKIYKTTLPSDMIFTKADASTSDDQVAKLTRKFNIYYRSCIGSLIYLLSTRVDLSFAVHKLSKFSSNPGKLHFKGLVHVLRYIRYNINFWVKLLCWYEWFTFIWPVDKASINTDNQLMDFSDYSWKDGPYTGRSIEAYMIFYQGVTFDHGTHVTELVAQ